MYVYLHTYINKVYTRAGTVTSHHTYGFYVYTHFFRMYTIMTYRNPSYLSVCSVTRRVMGLLAYMSGVVIIDRPTHDNIDPVVTSHE